jgi:hypothetical protein
MVPDITFGILIVAEEASNGVELPLLLQPEETTTTVVAQKRVTTEIRRTRFTERSENKLSPL